MNERKPRTSQREPFEQAGARSAPIAVDDPVVATSADQAEAPDPLGACSHAVYCDNEQEVRKGFAIALRAMGLG